MRKNLGYLVVILIIIIVFVFFKKYSKEPLGDVDKDIVVKLDSSPVVSSKKSVSAKEYLTDSKGLTLYTFSNDEKMKSNCTLDCLTKWPPFYYDNKNFQTNIDSLSKKMNVFKRADGKFQYAYGEQPVYYYSGDKKAGETNGVGLNSGKWKIVLITK